MVSAIIIVKVKESIDFSHVIIIRNAIDTFYFSFFIEDDNTIILFLQ